MNKDIGNIIKSCSLCNKPNKFKKKKKNKNIILDDNLIIDMYLALGI